MAFHARYPGVCAKCREAIHKGDAITWSRRRTGPRGGRVIYHFWCAKELPEEDRLPEPETQDGQESEPQEERQEKSRKTFDAANAVASLGSTLEDMNRRLESVEDAVTSPDGQDVDEEKVREIISKSLAEITRPTIVVLQNRDGREVNVEGVQHSLFPRLLYHVQNRENVYLWGDSQSGKSTGAHNVAKALELAYYYLSANPQTPDSRLMGYNDANGRYIETVFYKAYSQGGVFCIDEVDNASSSFLTTLNSALANGLAAFPCGMIERHKDFVCIATGNTPGHGGTPQYPERRPLDGAFRERFSFMEWQYDLALEEALVLGINPESASLLKWIRQIRSYCKTQGIPVLATPTASMRLAKYALDKQIPFDAACDAVLWKGLDREKVRAVLQANRPGEGIAW